MQHCMIATFTEVMLHRSFIYYQNNQNSIKYVIPIKESHSQHRIIIEDDKMVRKKNSLTNSIPTAQLV